MQVTEERPCEDRGRKQLSTEKDKTSGKTQPARTFTWTWSLQGYEETHVRPSGHQVFCYTASLTNRRSSALLHVQGKVTHALPWQQPISRRITGLEESSDLVLYLCITQKGMWVLSLRQHCS